MGYNFGPIFTTALLRTTINPLDLSIEVSWGRRTWTIIIWEFHVTMVEKELQCMTALQNHLCECSSDIAIIIGIIYLMFSPYEWFLYMIYVKIIMMFEFEFSIKLKESSQFLIKYLHPRELMGDMRFAAFFSTGFLTSSCFSSSFSISSWTSSSPSRSSSSSFFF